MVQRKALNKLPSQNESRTGHAKPARSLSFHGFHRQNWDTVTKLGEDCIINNKNKMRKMSSINPNDFKRLEGSLTTKNVKLTKSLSMKRPKGSPNYMNPTSNSIAKKAAAPPAQVHSSSTSSSSSGLQPAKVLIRVSSFKLGRTSSMKKSHGSDVKRSTCSSTQKEAWFPKALDLNPGGTEAEGTSVMKVCTYSYCSLNGHKHEPLPPLKAFLRARRQSLKNQKSMKLEELPALRKKDLDLDKKVDTGQTEDVANHFFVEIYAKQNLQEDVTDIDADRSSQISVEEMDVMMNLLEFVECDPRVEIVEEENQSSLVNEADEDWSVENDIKESGAADIDLDEGVGQYPDNITECSECADEVFDLMHETSLENHEVYEDLIDKGEAFANFGDEDGGLQAPDGDLVDKGEAFANFGDEDGGLQAPDALDIVLEASKLERNNEKISDFVNDLDSENCEDNPPLRLSLDDVELQAQDGMFESSIDADSDTPEASHLLKLDEDGIVQAEDSKIESNEESISSFSSGSDSENPEKLDEGGVLFQAEAPQDGNKDHESVCNEIEDEKKGNGVEDTAGSLAEVAEVEVSATFDALEEPEIQTENKIKQHEALESEEQCLESNDLIQCADENDDNTSAKSESDQSLKENCSKPKQRVRIIRKKKIQAAEVIREFNPRPPRFLPLEPGPDAEKVDLKHQMVDERKNAEEWMIDYALQNAVNKLTPMRKRRVALLVEAFEAVMPLTIQACS